MRPPTAENELNEVKGVDNFPLYPYIVQTQPTTAMTESTFIAQAPALRSKAIAVASRWVASDEAEDIAQDTLLRLWTLREAVQTPQHAEALVIKMAWQRCADGWRRCRTVPIDSGQAVADDRSAAPDACLEQADNEEWLHRRLASLPSMQYQVLRLRQVEQKSHTEIAAILGTTPHSVATLLSRARQQLLEAIRRRNRNHV